MRDLGVSLENTRRKVEEITGPAGNRTEQDAPLSPRARQALELASVEADNAHDHLVCTHHVLYGLIREGTGVAHQVLVGLGVNLAHYNIRKRVESYLKNEKWTEQTM